MSRVERLLFPKRAHRTSFFLRFLACLILSEVLRAYKPPIGSALSAPSVIVWLVIAGAMATYALFFVFLPRLRDAGMSAWWLVPSLFPYVNLVLAVALLFRGTADDSHTVDYADPFCT